MRSKISQQLLEKTRYSETELNVQDDIRAWAELVKCATEGTREAVRRHKLLNESIVIWRNGQTEVIAAKDIPWEWTGVTGPPE